MSQDIRRSRQRFAWFEINVDAVGVAQTTHGGDEGVDVVIGAGDVVAAAEVEPFHLVQEVAEVALDDSEGFDEGVDVLLAESVEMEAVDAGEICSMQRVSENAEAASFHAGIVDGVVLGRMHRIDAQAAAFAAGEGAVLEMIHWVRLLNTMSSA